MRRIKEAQRAFPGGLGIQAEFRTARTAKWVKKWVCVRLLSTRLHSMLRALIPGDEDPTPSASSHFRPARKSSFAMGRTLGEMPSLKLSGPIVPSGPD